MPHVTTARRASPVNNPRALRALKARLAALAERAPADDWRLRNARRGVAHLERDMGSEPEHRIAGRIADLSRSLAVVECALAREAAAHAAAAPPLDPAAVRVVWSRTGAAIPDERVADLCDADKAARMGTVMLEPRRHFGLAVPRG